MEPEDRRGMYRGPFFSMTLTRSLSLLLERSHLMCLLSQGQRSKPTETLYEQAVEVRIKIRNVCVGGADIAIKLTESPLSEEISVEYANLKCITTQKTMERTEALTYAGGQISLAFTYWTYPIRKITVINGFESSRGRCWSDGQNDGQSPGFRMCWASRGEMF
ncbi:hypothetical protein RRG08_032286 [Elysia crispata]|uniref:Uncharacterized protein n=1 Tax=Elysia crispata TaxID=231223 RepID=A0AAE1ARV8_9GAST|nr:hypothetical protein RRG08_032286 [Elysia crispata]